MTILRIDRSEPFNPAEIGEGWTIAKQDERSLTLTEVDLGKIRLTTSLKEGKHYIFAKTELKNVEGGNDIPLDARVFETLAQDTSLISTEIYKGNLLFYPPSHIAFWGTILKNPDGHLEVPVFRYERRNYGGCKRGWYAKLLKVSSVWRRRYFSAVLTDLFLH